MDMRRALTQAEQAYIEQRQRAGTSLRAIAAELACARVTVRKWWRRQRDGRLARPRGRPGRGPLSMCPAALVARAVELKQAHPHLGPANVKLELQRDERFREARLPSDALVGAVWGALPRGGATAAGAGLS